MTSPTGPGIGDDGDSSSGWWVTAEDHWFALVALQLPLRRRLLVSIGRESVSLDHLHEELGMGKEALRFHIDVLKKAHLVEEGQGGLTLTPVGLAYLEKMERFGS
ncbi:MAG: Helix-turn-helix domain protein [Methanosaeta sp. PtaB.Bin039]|nr:MAG: Helix-turn-helix domain protein [Methanosaeta sp. PtaB.Bin039]OPY44383.1 MAG: Helix-turn-helix domain protein [Methanosaeta sp. PtaU1.Bin028]HOT06247.1 hypothetical protein [Methanotrichaceae archaeon]HQF15443.1 hypothetical protein [Methanotrichaceae archaeon]HQI90178.1 hypothetical protein [Methanotrichaceae archaeon]